MVVLNAGAGEVEVDVLSDSLLVCRPLSPPPLARPQVSLHNIRIQFNAQSRLGRDLDEPAFDVRTVQNQQLILPSAEGRKTGTDGHLSDFRPENPVAVAYRYGSAGETDPRSAITWTCAFQGDFSVIVANTPRRLGAFVFVV